MTHFTDRISAEEIAQSALISERKRIENAVYRTRVALDDAMENRIGEKTIADCELVAELLDEHKGQLLRLQSHIAKHGAVLHEDAYESRRLAEARSVA